MQTQQASSAVGVKQFNTLVLGVSTDIVIINFTDIWMVTVSQTGRFGTWIRASSEEANAEVSNGMRCYEVDTVLGNREQPVLCVYARQLAERLPITGPQQLMLAVALKDYSKEMLRAILGVFDKEHLFTTQEKDKSQAAS